MPSGPILLIYIREKPSSNCIERNYSEICHSGLVFVTAARAPASAGSSGGLYRSLLSGVVFFEGGDGGFGRWMVGLELVSADGGRRLFCASSTASTEGTGGGLREARGRPPADMPQRQGPAAGGPLLRLLKQKCCDGASRSWAVGIRRFSSLWRRFGGGGGRDRRSKVVCTGPLKGFVVIFSFYRGLCAFSLGHLSIWIFPGWVRVCVLYSCMLG
jgi:hypothetical protein